MIAVMAVMAVMVVMAVVAGKVRVRRTGGNVDGSLPPTCLTTSRNAAHCARNYA